MYRLLQKQSMRVKLLSLIFIAFMLAIAGLGVGINIIQKNLLNQMEISVAQLLDENTTQIKTKFNRLGQEVTQSLDQMPESVGSKIAAKTSIALNGEKTIVSSDLEQSLHLGMDSLTELLAKVAPAAILSNDFTTLISYAKSASLGKDIVYVIYLKPDGDALTRYYDTQKPKIKEFLAVSKEQKKINRILSASQNDPEVMIIKKTIAIDGNILGAVVLCISKKSMGEKLAAMEQRFSNLIKSNNQEAANTLNHEAKKIISQFSSKLNDISSSNSAAVKKVGEQIKESITTVKQKISWVMLSLGAISIIIILIILFYVISKITQKINHIAGTIDNGSIQVSLASEQVSKSSQDLAEASSRQAAAIEETSASMEEISAMTKQNTDNAQMANTLMNTTLQTMGNANNSMDKLIASMEDISRASEETSKIIKTIDEIAFQTNLLALNAAVEAARAGESGAGFAVVADEVRNLAMRSAAAAKNTATLIEDTIKKIKKGSEHVNSTHTTFAEVTSVSSKVGQLVETISSASREQSEGIFQVNTALVEMDNITQQNAATSEESASTAEEMNAQAMTMTESVEELIFLIQGSKREHKEPESPKLLSTFRKKPIQLLEKTIDVE